MTARLCPGTCSGCRSAEPALRGRTDGKGRTRDGAPGTGHGTAYVKVVKMAHLHHVYFIPKKTNTRQGKVEPVKASEMQSAPCPRSDVLIYLKTPSPESGGPGLQPGAVPGGEGSEAAQRGAWPQRRDKYWWPRTQRVGPSVPACITLHPNLPPDSPGGKEVLVVSPELKPGWRRPVRIRHCPNREKG